AFSQNNRRHRVTRLRPLIEAGAGVWQSSGMLKTHRCAGIRYFLPALLLASCLIGCSTPHEPAASHAFIAYWPPPENDKRLRLAVKDLIDMKGVVTTAGSEYLAKHSPPAPRDAKCLALARE